ncbi:MAG: NAD(P)H-dependent oxidoreductase [Pseudomonadota bacterium]|mgnify:CR=1 FL=1
MSKVLVICGHPRKDSFCGALAEAYAAGARRAGADLELLYVTDLAFDPNVHFVSPNQQITEPDIFDARQRILAATHLVFVYPNWWGTMPALLKAFLDRVLAPGFAFHEDERQPGRYVPHLDGRSAELLVSMDTPPWVFRHLFHAPGDNAMRHATLGFCGIRTLRARHFGPVTPASAAQRKQWVQEARAAGVAIYIGLEKARRKTRRAAWVKLMRLQFYPMTFLAYAIGALAAAQVTGRWDAGVFWLGYLFIFVVEVITVFSNEYFDYPSDKLNQNAGPFNGGSRVLVKGELSFGAVRAAIVMLALGLLPLGYLLFKSNAALTSSDGLLIGAIGLLAISYTVPPLKLVYRGWGELTVAATHSALVVLCGYALQSGSWTDPYPWLVSLPLFFAILPSIILSAIPDYQADLATGKRTAVVTLGARGAVAAAMACTAGAAMAAVFLHWRGYLPGLSGWLIYLVLPHAWWLLRRLRRFYQEGAPCRSIDDLMVLSLTYVLWFVLVPLLVVW